MPASLVARLQAAAQNRAMPQRWPKQVAVSSRRGLARRSALILQGITLGQAAGPPVRTLKARKTRMAAPVSLSRWSGLLRFILAGPRYGDRMFAIIAFEPAVIAHAHSVALSQVN